MAAKKPMYSTAPTSVLKKFRGAGKKMRQLETNEPKTGYFFKEPEAQKQWSQARVQRQGAEQRYDNSPRLQAIKKANERFTSNVMDSRESGGNIPYLGKTRVSYVQRNWKKFL